MSDEEGYQQDLEHLEKLAIDCVLVVHQHGLEGTAKELAVLLGVTNQVRKRLDAQRIAA